MIITNTAVSAKEEKKKLNPNDQVLITVRSTNGGGRQATDSLCAYCYRLFWLLSFRSFFSLFFSRIPTITTTQEVKRLQQHTYRLVLLSSIVKKKKKRRARKTMSAWVNDRPMVLDNRLMYILCLQLTKKRERERENKRQPISNKLNTYKSSYYSSL
jgi:hypothetical protein